MSSDPIPQNSISSDTGSRVALELSRRTFLGSSARSAANVAAGVLGMGLAASAAQPDVRDLVPVRLGVIGVRQRGRQLATLLATQPKVELGWLADVDHSVLQKTAASLAEVTSSPRLTGDFRDMLDDRQVQGVVIATPDHTHVPLALAALEAGKDVYLETPATRTLRETRDLLEAAARSSQIVQVGVQERSSSVYQAAMSYLHQGQLGTVKLARAWVVHRRKPIPAHSDSSTPKGVDYAGWLGHAPSRSFNANRFHGNWRWFWDYGGGELSSWGAHWLDVARWGLAVRWPDRVAAFGGQTLPGDAVEVPDTLTAHYAFGDKSIHWEHRVWSGHAPEGRSSAVAFYGTRGVLMIDRGGWKVYDGEPAGQACSANDLDLAHLRQFLNSIRTRQKPSTALSDILASTTCCHLGNVAYRVGRELRFDPASGRCLGDSDATAMLVG